MLFFQSEEKESESLIKTEIKSSEPEEIGVHEDAFFMVSQSHWEDDVIWDGDDIKQKARKTISNLLNKFQHVEGLYQSTLNFF